MKPTAIKRINCDLDLSKFVKLLDKQLTTYRTTKVIKNFIPYIQELNDWLNKI